MGRTMRPAGGGVNRIGEAARSRGPPPGAAAAPEGGGVEA
jgi:hypothetical protein